MTTKQFTPDLKLKAVNYYHKINNCIYNLLCSPYPTRGVCLK